MDNICQLCDRKVDKLTKHHLLPREEGGNEEHISYICSDCHRQIHALYTNKELAIRLDLSLIHILIGALGSVFSISMKMQGFIQLFAALFMVIAGLNMFGIKLFKNINLSIPFMKKNCGKSNKNPFVVGILNCLLYTRCV